LAGSSLLCSAKKDNFKTEDGDPYKQYHLSWTNSLVDHVDLALTLHEIEDIYIVEHDDCGAYKSFLKEYDKTGHAKYAKELADHLRAVAFYKRNEKDEWNKHYLTVTCFIIDLRGNVKVLDKAPPKRPEPENPTDNYCFRDELAKRLQLPKCEPEKQNINQ
jgi:hypothetical protein